jgi:hypothetical protein
MSTFDTDEAIRLAVGEIQPNGRFPVTVTFTSGGEHYRSVGDLAAVEGLRTEFNLKPRDVLFRGRSRIQLGQQS